MTAPNYAYQPDHEPNYLIDYGRREPEREKRRAARITRAAAPAGAGERHPSAAA